MEMIMSVLIQKAFETWIDEHPMYNGVAFDFDEIYDIFKSIMPLDVHVGFIHLKIGTILMRLEILEFLELAKEHGYVKYDGDKLNLLDKNNKIVIYSH